MFYDDDKFRVKTLSSQKKILNEYCIYNNRIIAVSSWW